MLTYLAIHDSLPINLNSSTEGAKTERIVELGRHQRAVSTSDFVSSLLDPVLSRCVLLVTPLPATIKPHIEPQNRTLIQDTINFALKLATFQG